MTSQEKLNLVMNYFSEDWAIKKAMQLLEDYESTAGIVLEDAAQVEIDLFNDLNRVYGNTLTAYAKEMCRLGYRKTNAARKQGGE